MAINESQPDDTGARPTPPQQISKIGRALSNVKRELSDEELSSPGVQKMLLNELERLWRENEELSGYRNEFHEADKKVSVLEEKLKRNIALEIVSLSCIAIGAAALVYAPVAWDHQPNGWIAVVFGGLATIAGVGAKAVELWL